MRPSGLLRGRLPFPNIGLARSFPERTLSACATPSVTSLSASAIYPPRRSSTTSPASIGALAGLENTPRSDARQALFSPEMVDTFPIELTLAELETVAVLPSWQMEARARNQLEKRMRRAKFLSAKAFAAYSLSPVSFLEDFAVADLRSLSLIDATLGSAFHGQMGRGKMRLTIATGIDVTNKRKTVHFFTTAELVMQLAEDDGFDRIKQGLAVVSKTDLFVLDKLGYVPLYIKDVRLL